MKENSLPKNLILKKRKDITDTLRNGKRIEYGSMRLILLKSNGESNLKVAFLVSKKLGRKAVLRNRIKRWMREIFRTNKQFFPENSYIILTPVVKYAEITCGMLKKDFMEIVKSERFTDHRNKIISEASVAPQE